MACCGQPDGPREKLATRLLQVFGPGVIPPGAQVWGPYPDRGWEWRAVDRQGQDLTVPLGGVDPIQATVDAEAWAWTSNGVVTVRVL